MSENGKPMTRPQTPFKKRLRRFKMQLSTMLGRPEGFFSPYRYADMVAPTGYPELEPTFEAALVTTAADGEPGMAGYLDIAEARMPDIQAALGEPPKPRFEQGWFTGLDAVAAFVMASQVTANRIVEVGSGHSTRFLAAGAAARMASMRADGGAELRETEIICIDPVPRAVLQGLPVTWRETILTPEHFSLFQSLEPGDIAFFDSSHLLWPGSDVDLIFNRILPILKPGVLVHIHDILLPDAYPDVWEWRGYTEQNGLAGWFAGGAYHLVWASHWLGSRDQLGARAALRAVHPSPSGGSIWMRRA